MKIIYMIDIISYTIMASKLCNLSECRLNHEFHIFKKRCALKVCKLLVLSKGVSLKIILSGQKLIKY